MGVNITCINFTRVDEALIAELAAPAAAGVERYRRGGML